MRKLWVALIILGCIVLSLVFRVVIPFNNVFTSNGVVLNTPDAYYIIRYADTSPIPSHDYFMDYPRGTGVNTQWMLVARVVGFLARAFHTDAIVIGAILPPIIFILILLIVYFIALLLFNNQYVALGSILVLSILPGNILNRTMLGSPDTHFWEVFLISFFMLFAVLFIKNINKKIAIIYGLVCALVLWVFWMSWAGALLVVFIVGLTWFIWSMRWINIWFFRLIVIGGLIAVGVCLFAVIPDRIIAGLSISRDLFTFNTTTFITEEMPAIFTNGQFELGILWNYYGVTFFLFLIGYGWLIFRYVKTSDASLLLFLVWTTTVLFMMLSKRRFDYYMGVNIAIVTTYMSVGVYRAFQKRGRKVAVLILVAIMCCLQLLSIDIQMASTKQGYMTEAWQETTGYLKQYGDKNAYLNGTAMEYGVFAWWDYGYWIVQGSNLPAYRTPSTTDLYSSDIWVSNPSDAIKKLRELKMKYIIIDKEMLGSKLKPILRTRTFDSNMFLFQLFYGKVEGTNLIFNSSDCSVKVFALSY